MTSLHLVYVYVPPNCTALLCPLHLSVQRTVKEHLRNQLESHFAEVVAKQIQNSEVVKMELPLTKLKQLGAKWLVSSINHLR